MKSTIEIQSFLDKQELAGLEGLLEIVIGWQFGQPDVAGWQRRIDAGAMLEKLQGADGEHWVEPAKEFLRNLIPGKEELITQTWSVK